MGRRSGNPDCLAEVVERSGRARVYFMGKDNITFHAQIWPTLLLATTAQATTAASPARTAR